MDSIGEKIRELREIRNLTQEELAERCGVSSSCISRWENGYLQPNTKNIMALSSALDAGITELFPSYAVKPSESLVVREILATLEKMTEPEQRIVLNALIQYQEIRQSITNGSIS